MSAAPNKPEGLDMTVTEKDVIETCEVHGFPLDPDQLEVVAAVVNQMQLSAAPFQARVQPWMLECFGAEIAADKIERNHRFFEEATEAVQANGMTRSEAHQLVDYTFDRPVGELHQEIGGVMVTLAALCLASGQDMHAAGETELARIWTKVEAIRAKQAAKPKHSPLPAAPAQSPSLIGWWDSAEASGFRWKEGIVRSDFSNGTPIYATEPFLSFIPDAKRDELIGALLADLEKSDQRETDFFMVLSFIVRLSLLAAQFAPAAPAQSEEPVAWTADSLYDAIEKVLLSHKLSNWQDQHGNLLGLVDRLCDDDAHDIASGQHAIRLICDEIYNEVLTVAAPQPAQPVEAGEPWIAHWAGSNPYKGWSIRCGREEVIWFGETISSETVEGIVLAHNKCFDCEGTGCVMNCSGLREEPAPSAVALDDERAAGALQHALDWINHQKHGDNCFLSSHYPGDPGDRCNCGKDSVMQSIETALESLVTSTQWQSHAIAGPVAEPAPYLPCPICKGVEGCDHTVPERKRATENAIYQSRVEGFETAWRDVSKETFDECSAINTFETRIVYPVAQSVEQTRALTDEQIEDLQEAREILENMVRSVELDGNYSTEATCTFLRQALQCLPAAQPASGSES